MSTLSPSQDSFSCKAKVLLREEGICYVEDCEIGTKVEQFEEQRFPFQTEAGLDFCKALLWEDKRIRDTIESIFERSSLTLLKPFGAKQGTVFCLYNNTPSNPRDPTVEVEDTRALLVQLFSKNTVVSFYKRSHLLSLNAQGGKTGWLEVPPKNLDDPSIELVELTIKDGGFAILDSRLGFEISQGTAVIAGFITEPELKFCQKMKYPARDVIIQHVKEMQGARIGMNVVFVRSTGAQSMRSQ